MWKVGSGTHLPAPFLRDRRDPGDHRGNMHVGALVQAVDLSESDRKICATIGPWLKDSGLLFVGIDTIGTVMTEINVTSPTGIREINQLMGTKLESDLTNAVESKLAIHRQRGLK